jgi:membrane-associated phospholipid phosphatase
VSRASGALAALSAAAFAALAVLVAHGSLTPVDQWSVRHAMPGARFTGEPTTADALIPLWGEWWHNAVAVTMNVLTAPAELAVATALVAVVCWKVRGRGAVALAAAYVAGNVIEEIVKTTLTRPPLHAGRLDVAAFTNSYPSGHTIRIVLLAVAVGVAWPKLRVPAATWALATLVFLVLGGWHVPSDVVGGLLLVAALLATTWASCFGRGRSSSPSTASPPSARAR